MMLLVVAGLTAGCEQSSQDRLEGFWVGEEVAGFGPAGVARAQGWASGTMFGFKGSRATVSIPAESPRSGTYKVEKAEGQSLQLAFLRPHGVSDSASFVFEEDGRLRWVLGQGRSILMRKQSD